MNEELKAALFALDPKQFEALMHEYEDHVHARAGDRLERALKRIKTITDNVKLKPMKIELTVTPVLGMEGDELVVSYRFQGEIDGEPIDPEDEPGEDFEGILSAAGELWSIRNEKQEGYIESANAHIAKQLIRSLATHGEQNYILRKLYDVYPPVDVEEEE